MNIKSLIAIPASVLLLCSCGSKQEEKKEGGGKGAGGRAGGPVRVDVIVAAPSPVSTITEASGTVIASESVELRPEISGRLTYLNIPEGKRVTKGTVLARVNDADIRANIAKNKAQLQLAEKTAERYRKLYEIGGLNQSEYDVAVNQIATLQADINFQYAQLSRTVVQAPFTGVVGLRQVSPGAYVSPQNVLATLQKLDEVKIDFTLPQEYGDHLKVGNIVTVSLANDEKRYRARVIAVEPQIEQNTRNLKVRTVLENGNASPGAFAKVYVQQGEDKNSIMVPTNAIIPEAKDKKLVLVKNGKAVMTSVVTGIRKEQMVAIETGVNQGDTIVVSGVLFARPNTPVKIGKVLTYDDLNENKQRQGQ